MFAFLVLIGILCWVFLSILSLVDNHYERKSRFGLDVVKCEMQKLAVREYEEKTEQKRLEWEIVMKRLEIFDNKSEEGGE